MDASLKIDTWQSGGNRLRTTAFKFGVSEWQTFTIADFHLNNAEIGVPTVLLLSSTTTRESSMGTGVLNFNNNRTQLSNNKFFQEIFYIYINSKQANAMLGRYPED